jgi:hypothetical protein
MLLTEIITVRWEVHVKHINVQRGKDKEMYFLQG